MEKKARWLVGVMSKRNASQGEASEDAKKPRVGQDIGLDATRAADGGQRPRVASRKPSGAGMFPELEEIAFAIGMNAGANRNDRRGDFGKADDDASAGGLGRRMRSVPLTRAGDGRFEEVGGFAEVLDLPAESAKPVGGHEQQQDTLLGGLRGDLAEIGEESGRTGAPTAESLGKTAPEFGMNLKDQKALDTMNLKDQEEEKGLGEKKDEKEEDEKKSARSNYDEDLASGFIQPVAMWYKNDKNIRIPAGKAWCSADGKFLYLGDEPPVSMNCEWEW